MIKTYFVIHNFEQYTVQQFIDEINDTGFFSYSFSQTDSRQMKKNDICYIYFCGIDNSISPRILLSSVVHSNNKITLELKILNFINSETLSCDNLKKNASLFNFQSKHILKDIGISYINDVFKKSLPFKPKDFLCLSNSKNEDNFNYQESVQNCQKIYNNTQIKLKNNRKPCLVKNVKNNRYNTDSGLAKTVFNKKNYLCEINIKHTTFLNKYDCRYMEAHHLVPMKYQRNFKENIDCTDNIICLCPSCHREIHYGKNSNNMIKMLYEKVKNKEFFVDNKITETQLLELYNLNENNI